MNGTLLHVTRQHVAYFVLCVLIKISCLITTFRRQILFTRRSSHSGAWCWNGSQEQRHKVSRVINKELLVTAIQDKNTSYVSERSSKTYEFQFNWQPIPRIGCSNRKQIFALILSIVVKFGIFVHWPNSSFIHNTHIKLQSTCCVLIMWMMLWWQRILGF